MVSYMLMTELEGARQRRLLTWGFLLLFVNLSVVVATIWLQLSESNRQAILQLMLLEREIREAELVHDAQSLRADVERFQRVAGVRLVTPPSLNDALPDAMDDASADSKLQGALMDGPLPSYTKQHYPCWVISLSELRNFGRLPKHEDLLPTNLLDELTNTSTRPSCAYSFFISQCVTIVRLCTREYDMCLCAEIGRAVSNVRTRTT